MAKSLDGLIRHLVDEIALCGVEGALPLDFLNHINTYYEKRPQDVDGRATCDDDDQPDRSTFAIDRSFQEQVWKWLTCHPEIRVGKNREGNTLSLSEFEALNHSRNQQRPTSQKGDCSVPAQYTVTSISREAQAAPETTRDESRATAKGRSSSSTAISKNSQKQNPSGNLRLYSSEYRMWQVAAGHEPDPSRVPALDFACLSIIAAQGPKGILQPELVTVSGQDKRSLPTRTDRLQQNGYIEKRPVLVSGSRTSLCTLKRFVTAQSTADGASTSTQEISLSHTQNDKVLDMLSLTRGVFDNLRDLEIITTDDLKKKLGVWGFRWPMRVLARTLRQLEALGCVKQVRAQANSDLPSVLYFKCVKLIREPTETEWQLFLSPHRGLLSLINAREGEDVDTDGEVDEDYDADDSVNMVKDSNGAPAKGLQEVRRPIAQWDGDCCLNNLLFDLVDRSGTQGMSSMDLKRLAFGGLVKRPLEYQLGRLENQWQISQPPHLRHLAIIRDTAMKRSVTHYVHYSYENFKSLVDSGRASWEAVETIPENKKKGKSALSSKPDLEEYGFPKLQTSLFQGELNDATPSECALAVKVKPLSLASFDSILKKLDDGTYVARTRARRGRPAQMGPTESIPQRLSFKPRGRPRKVPRTGLPSNVDSMTTKEMNQMARLQQAAVKYDVQKIEREIYKRVDAGEDQTVALDAVLREVADEHSQLGLPPSLAIKAVRARFTMPGEKEDKPILPKEVLPEVAGEVNMDPRKALKRVRQPSGKGKGQTSGYLPSAAVHFKPVVIESSLASTLDPESGPRKEPCSPRASSESTASTHVPSITTPIQPVLQPFVLNQSTAKLQSRHDSTRGATNDERKVPQDPLSIYEPTFSQITPDDLTESDLHFRKKRKRGLPSKNIEECVSSFVPRFKKDLKRKRSDVESLGRSTKTKLQYLPSVVAHSQRNLLSEQSSSRHEEDNQKRGPALGYFSKDLNEVAIQKTQINEIIPPSRTESEMRNYMKQLNDIKRPKDGIFLGGRTTVYRKGGSGPRRSRLAIFKLRRLSEFMWYQKEMLRPELGVQTILDVDPKTRPNLKSIAAATPSFSARAPPAAQIGSANAPMHGPKSKTKRKRRASSVETPVRASPGSILTNKDNLRGLVPSRRAQGSESPSLSPTLSSFAPASPRNGTVPNPVKSIKKKLPVNLIQDGTPTTFHHANEGAASNLAGVLSGNPDKSAHSQWARSKSSIMETSSSTTGDANSPQQKVPGQSAFTSVTQSSQDGTGLSIEKTDFQHDSSNPPPLMSDHPTDASLMGEVQTKKRSQAKPMAKLPLTGGSLGFLRRKIVMDVVQKCGGVFPSDRELVYPFIYAWQKDGKPGTPERSTVTAACKSLYASGKLRQLYFSFKDKKGLMVTKPMMTVPEISPTDSRVKSVQQKIIDLYPKAYVPDEAEISEDVRTRFSTNPVYGTNRTFPSLEIDHESRVQLHHKPQYVQRIEAQMNPRGRTSKQRVWSDVEEVTEGSSTDSINPNQLATPGFVRHPDLDPTSSLPVRKVQRLASLKRPFSKTTTKPSIGHCDSSSRLDLNLGFGLFNHRWPSQSSIFPASRTDYLNHPSDTLQTQVISSKTRSDKHVQPDPYSPQLVRIGMSKDELPNLTGAAVLPTTKVMAGKHTEPYLPSTAAHTQPCIRKYKTRHYLPSIAAHTQPIFEPVKLKRQYFKKSQKFWTGEQLQSSRMNMKKLSPSASGELGFQYDLQSSVTTEVSRIKVAYALNASTSLSIDPWYAHQQISTVMDPDHYFHPATGTFSTTFKTVKKWDAKTQTVAQKETYKADQVYSDWGLSAQASEYWSSPQRTHKRTNFEIEIDTMLGWELETEGFERVAATDCYFINFTFQHPHMLSSKARINMDRVIEVSFSLVDGRIIYKPFTPSIVHKPKVGQKIDQRMASTETKKIAPAVSSESIEATAPVKRKRQKEPTEQFMSRRLTSLPEGQSYSRPRPSGEPSTKLDADGRTVKFRRVRGPKSLHGLGEDGEKRLVFATLVIRTLTGGIERHIDWVLVARLFAPAFDPKFIRARWNAVLNKWRFQYERLYPQFQEIFTQGYEDGSIPPIDYDDLESYDWAWLVDWTMENIEATTKSLPDLPAERSRFEERFAVKETYEHNMHIFYETDVMQPAPLRINNFLKQCYVSPVQEKDALTLTQESEQFAVAKSWIRANIITPNASYNSELAKERLLTFKEDTVDLALKELMASRVLSQRNKGRLVPGRNYNISPHVMDRLKKNIDLKNFHQAMAYKRQLDIVLKEKDAVDFDPTADDGVVLAVLNMQAHGRVEIRPKNPPMNKFGLTDGGYETRKMDKERLKFTCEIRLKDTYISGNPLLPLPPPPSQHLGIPMSRIPLWYDIHDKPVLPVWDMVLAATLAILSMQPGIDAEEIEKSMRPALEVWELELVLDWMVLAKVAKKMTWGYATAEWWWMGMGHGEGGGAPGAEVEGKKPAVETI